MNTHPFRSAAAALAIAVFLTAHTASAAIVTHYFHGLMNDPFGTHPIGTPFNGSLSYDDAQADIPAGPPTGNYVSQSFTVTVGGDTVSDTGTGLINVYDNLVTPYPTDLLLAYAANPVGTIGGLTLQLGSGLQLALQDVSGTAFPGIGLPGANLSLADLTPGSATFIQLYHQGNPFSVFARGELLRLNIPEPSTALLAAAGLLWLAACVRGRGAR